ncbi:hypothetical protein NQ176_g5242 [Zarea fungicola]|uniref:Uncharacterized protein n=1 Tax=Zarea fungicola TaxID=93591 RepID=A0ACC1NBV7_9HYPO|nr:hypothetical protein NQ176_g5242 [Lecanicillium fungicola]
MPEINDTDEAKLQSQAVEKSGGQESIADAVPIPGSLVTPGDAQHVTASHELDSTRLTTARFSQPTTPQAEAVSHTMSKASVAIELYDVISDSDDEPSTNAQSHLVEKASCQAGMKHNPIQKTGQQNKEVIDQTAGITKIADGPAERLPRKCLPLVNQAGVRSLATLSCKRNEGFNTANLNMFADGSIHPDIAQPEPSITGFNDKKPNAKADARNYGRKRIETGEARRAGNLALADYSMALDKLEQTNKRYADARSSTDENVPSRKSKKPRKSKTHTTDTINQGIIELGESSAEIAVEGNSSRQRPAFTNAKKRSATEDLIRDTIAELHYMSNSDNDNAIRKSNSPVLTKKPTERSNGRKSPSRATNLQPQRRIAPSTTNTVTYAVRPLEMTQKSVPTTKQSGHVVNTLAREHLQTYHDPQISNRTLGGISHHDSPAIGSQPSGMGETTRNKPGVSARTEFFKTGVFWPLGPVPPTPVVYYVDVAVQATDYQGIHPTPQGFRIDIRPGAEHYEIFNSKPITLPTVEYTPESSIHFTYALNISLPGLMRLRRAHGALHIALSPGARYTIYCRCNICGKVFSEFSDDGPEVVTTRPLCLALLRHPLHDLCCLCYHMDSFVSLGHPDHAFLFGHDDHTADPRKRTPSARVSDIPAVYIGS